MAPCQLASKRAALQATPVKWADESDDESTSGGDGVITECCSSGEEAVAPCMPPGTFANPCVASHAVQPQQQQVFLMPVVMNGMQVLMPMVAVDGGMMPATAEQMQGMAMVPSSPQQMQGMAMMPMNPQDMGCGSPQLAVSGHSFGIRGSVAELEAHAETLASEAAELEVVARRMKALSASATRCGVRVDRTEKAGKAAKVAKVEQVKEPRPEEGEGGDGRTTLMLRNLPKSYSRSTLLHLLDAHGFKLDYCFAYVPTDFKRLASFGYAFVGFNSHDDAARAQAYFQGFCGWENAPEDAQPCDVAWSGAVQGREQHIERYRNSPVMHISVPDEYKPAVYQQGQRVAFPAPTKRVQPPRLRQNFAASSFQ